METAFIKETIEYILDKLSVKAEFTGVSEINDGAIIKFSIKTDEPYILIGQNGKTLMALNHVIKKMFEQQVLREKFKPLNFIVDVNDYQEKQIRDLKDKAQIMAERARFFRSNVELMPMNPYERMIIHSFFTDVRDITTESVGEGRERRVVIKYVEF